MNGEPDTRLSPGEYAALAGTIYHHLSSIGVEIGVVRLPHEAAEYIRRHVESSGGDDGQREDDTPPPPSRAESGMWIAASIVVVAVVFLVRLG